MIDFLELYTCCFWYSFSYFFFLFISLFLVRHHENNVCSSLWLCVNFSEHKSRGKSKIEHFIMKRRHYLSVYHLNWTYISFNFIIKTTRLWIFCDFVCVCVWRWRNVFDKTNKTQWENFKRKSCWSVAKISPSVLDHTHIRTHAHEEKNCWIVACSLNKQLMSIDQSDARTAMMMVYMYGCVLYQRHGFLPQSFGSFVLFCASFNFTPLAYHFIMFTVECGQRGTYHKLLCYLYAPGIIYLLS